jgi:hypothetical protein
MADENTSKNRRDPVFQLMEKYKFLRENGIARKLCGHNASDNSFCKRLHIPRRTLMDSVEAGRLNAKHQRILAERCGFRLDWPEWSDASAKRNTPADERRDAFAQFERRYLDYHAALSKGGACEERRAAALLQARRLEEPYAIDDQLASLELFVNQAGPGEPLPVSIELICQAAPFDGVALGIKRGKLQIDCGCGHVGELRERAGYPEGFVIERGARSVRITLGGLRRRPSWIIEADNGPIGVLSLADNFCSIRELVPGSTVKASFSVYVKDLQYASSPEEARGEGDPEEDSYSFFRPTQMKLGRAKQMILKRLAELPLGGDNGWAVVCRDARRFEEMTGDGQNWRNEP